jgi:hypothetical protein
VADAVFVDGTRSADRFLNDSFAVVGCRGGLDPEMHWDINIGVAFYNLRHPDTPALLRDWVTWINGLWDAKLNKARDEDYVGFKTQHVLDDQQILHKLLEKHPRGRSIVRRYFGEDSLAFNYEGDYIAHIIRGGHGPVEERLQMLEGLRNRYYVSIGTPS